ncbi:YraN family protein [bacterium]|jgi:putative endonuclease|nr:YraN family protein [bacterium]MBT4649089.1 YraN family protein [bacterium]
MLRNKKQLGQKGENIAAEYYQKLGYEIIARNFYTRYGELDLVLKKNNKILVIEVKTRTNHNFGYGEESISDKKLHNIYIAHKILREQQNLPTFFEIEVCVIYTYYNRYTIDRFII